MRAVLLVSTRPWVDIAPWVSAAAQADLALCVGGPTRADDLDAPHRPVVLDVTDPQRASAAMATAASDLDVAGAIGLDPRAALIAALSGVALTLPGHDPDGVRCTLRPLHLRGRLMAAGLPVPWFFTLPAGAPVEAFADRVRLPCRVRRADDVTGGAVEYVDTVDALAEACVRVRDRDQHAEGGTSLDQELLIEGATAGQRYVIEGVMVERQFMVVATLAVLEADQDEWHVTPPALPEATERLMATTVAHAAMALGLTHGPVHAECLVGAHGVEVVALSATPGWAAYRDVLRFASRGGDALTFADVLLRACANGPLQDIGPAAGAAGVWWPGAASNTEGRWANDATTAPRVTAFGALPEDVVRELRALKHTLR